MTTYRMSGKTYTRDELREVSKAEAADLPPATWRDASSTSSLAKGAKLPKSIGTMPATGGGRNRRGRVTGGIGQSAKQAGAARSRVKLIG
jgi:hypothetical protein